MYTYKQCEMKKKYLVGMIAEIYRVAQISVKISSLLNGAIVRKRTGWYDDSAISVDIDGSRQSVETDTANSKHTNTCTHIF